MAGRTLVRAGAGPGPRQQAPAPKKLQLTSSQRRLVYKGSEASSSGQGTPQAEEPQGTSRRSLLRDAFLTPCLCCIGAGAAGGAPAQAAVSGTWGYGPTIVSDSGPYGWKGMCAVGSAQSPVNIPVSKPTRVVDADPYSNDRILPFFSKTNGCSVSNAGHGTMQVNFPSGMNTTIIGGRKLELVQFHFHTPSEHTLDWKRFAMEAHLVHRDMASGELSVLGTMLTRGRNVESNPCLRKALNLAPVPGQKHAEISFDPTHLLPPPSSDGRRPHCSYHGSLTTPPCSEGVNWYIFVDPLPVADMDVLDFIEFCGNGVTGMNARPVQPMNEREWLMYRGV